MSDVIIAACSLPQVAELFEEMAQVEALMKRLAVHRSGLRRRINSIVPISRLPPEILIEIFSLVCQTSSTTPIFLGSICADWRSLAWNTPLLWCRITLEVSDALPKSRPHLLSEWLLRFFGLGSGGVLWVPMLILVRAGLEVWV